MKASCPLDFASAAFFFNSGPTWKGCLKLRRWQGQWSTILKYWFYLQNILDKLLNLETHYFTVKTNHKNILPWDSLTFLNKRTKSNKAKINFQDKALKVISRTRTLIRTILRKQESCLLVKLLPCYWGKK